MGICSYTWEKWDDENGKRVIKDCQKSAWEGSKEYCIFHDSSQEKDSELFRQKIEEQFSKKDYGFIGYCFPKDWSFENRIFGEDADFSGATFQKTNFRGAIIEKIFEFTSEKDLNLETFVLEMFQWNLKPQCTFTKGSFRFNSPKVSHRD